MTVNWLTRGLDPIGEILVRPTGGTHRWEAIVSIYRTDTHAEEEHRGVGPTPDEAILDAKIWFTRETKHV